MTRRVWLAIDLFGRQGFGQSAQSARWAANALATFALGTHEDKVRVVMDMASAMPDFDVAAGPSSKGDISQEQGRLGRGGSGG